MSWDPRNFFVGLADFFTILLPGAIAVMAAAWFFPESRTLVTGLVSSDLAQGLVVLALSYVAGHFVFGAASNVDFLYDWLANRTIARQIEALAGGHALRPAAPLATAIAESLGMSHATRNRPLATVIELRNGLLGKLCTRPPMNAYQWAKLWLADCGCEQHLKGVERNEADSKFFRSFAMLVPLIALLWIVSRLLGGTAGEELSWPQFAFAWAGLAVGGILALMRYLELRAKSITLAYRAAVVHAAGKGHAFAQSGDGGPRPWAGGIVVRLSGGVREYLLVRAAGSAEPGGWSLPMGPVEPGEGARPAAVRAVFEACARWARPLPGAGELPCDAPEGGASCTMLVMQDLGRFVPRLRRWVAPWDSWEERECDFRPLATIEAGAFDPALLQLLRQAEAIELPGLVSP